jgi:hypothetical protein
VTAARAALPWYVHPAEDPDAWQRLALQSPRPSFVVVNVHNGPGEPDDPWYPEALTQLRGTRLVGYVDLAYGERPVAEVAADVTTWLDVYRVGGVMLDQFPSDAASTRRCVEYVTAARRAGAGFVVGNPGVVPALGHLALLDVTCVFEGSADAYSRFTPPPALCRVPRNRVWHLVHSCPPDELAEVTARAERLGAGHAFVTDRSMPHPWGGFPMAGTPVTATRAAS